MNKIIVIVTLISGLYFMVSCKKESDPPPANSCGTSHDDQKAWNTTATKDSFPWDDKNWGNYIEGKSRVFQVPLDMVTNVCPDKSIALTLQAQLKPFPTRAIDIRIRYNYGALGISGDTLKSMKIVYPDRTEYLGATEFSIIDAFQGQPGSFYLTVEWIIEDHQDYNVDLEYFKSQFTYTVAGYTWYEYLEK